MRRRHLLKGGIALPFTPLALSACSSGSGADNMYLQNNFAGVADETTATNLQVTGTIPADLNGRFLRNGPNPGADVDTGSYHWFTGRGMVHGLRLNEGRADWYHSRFVGGSAANTNVIGHGGRTMAIVDSRPFAEENSSTQPSTTTYRKSAGSPSLINSICAGKRCR